MQNEISIYKGELTKQCIVQSVATIKKAFPSLPLGFYDVLIDRITANGFSDARLRDAIYHVIDNCCYPTPTIANFISFDQKVRAYSYAEYLKLIDQGEPGKNYKQVKLIGKPVKVWIHLNDIEAFRSQIEETDPPRDPG